MHLESTSQSAHEALSANSSAELCLVEAPCFQQGYRSPPRTCSRLQTDGFKQSNSVDWSTVIERFHHFFKYSQTDVSVMGIWRSMDGFRSTDNQIFERKEREIKISDSKTMASKAENFLAPSAQNCQLPGGRPISLSLMILSHQACSPRP